jgi:hypothetical protein
MLDKYSLSFSFSLHQPYLLENRRFADQGCRRGRLPATIWWRLAMFQVSGKIKDLIDQL